MADHEPGRQFYLGPAYTGAPLHWHNTALNVLAYGQKRWLVVDEEKTFYRCEHFKITVSGEHCSYSCLNLDTHFVLSFCFVAAAVLCSVRPAKQLLKDDAINLAANVSMKQCIQNAGDIIFVGDAWGESICRKQQCPAAARHS